MEFRANKTLWRVTEGDGPIVATAIHDGHMVRDEVGKRLAISADERLREEDPYTGIWTDIAETRIVVNISRFQMDLNRPRAGAMYVKPEDSWGLNIWKEKPTQELIAGCLKDYDQFYAMAHEVLSGLEKRFGKMVVLDLHTYNHRREGPDGMPAKVEDSPEVNIGTGSLDRQQWATLADRFIRDLSGFDFLGRRLDVRENVRFPGGHFSRWVHQNFPKSVCVLAVEVKKFFMDEWTGMKDQKVFSAIHKALGSTIPGVIEELNKIGGRT